MRRTVLALATIALLIGGCQQPASTTAEGEPAAVDAAPPEMPADAPPQEEVPDQTAATGEPGSCLAEVGADASARLVQRCIAVSPATHPPCNAANPCAMIQGEIDRSCEMYAPGEARPAECAA
ncbi:MAG: hypothetical protein PSV23_14510 [Brevundimonas sp.]|uniref:hypothetical protein n=1 Tax=Brevundimonas sp. TaxID=1871086 RepID=UPI002487C459|nr:hypothetical protein [Brevundimonas sp.]MDI1328000.1 hypothetical protein [Brevundimonas sp.]